MAGSVPRNCLKKPVQETILWRESKYWAAYGLVAGEGRVGDDGLWTQSVSVNLADTNVSGHLDPEVHSAHTYTYDILVMEYTGDTAPNGPEHSATIDYNYLKTPYCLWVPETTPETPPREGHTVWLHVPEDGGAPPEFRVTYWLNDQCQRGAQDLELVVVGPDLQARNSASSSWPQALNTLHGGEDANQDGEPDGLTAFVFDNESFEGTWRVLWTAEAPCGVKTRNRHTHDAQRMLVANQYRKPTYSAFADDVGSFGAWAATAKNALDTVASRPKGGLNPTAGSVINPREAVEVRKRMLKDGVVFLAGEGITYETRDYEFHHRGDAVETRHNAIALSDMLVTSTGVARRLHGLPYPRNMDPCALVTDYGNGTDKVAWEYGDGPNHQGLRWNSYKACRFLFVAACNSAKGEYSIVPIAVRCGGVGNGLGFNRTMAAALSSEFNDLFWAAFGRKDWKRAQWRTLLGNCRTEALGSFWTSNLVNSLAGDKLRQESDELLPGENFTALY
jgi:hypothetical protein